MKYSLPMWSKFESKGATANLQNISAFIRNVSYSWNNFAIPQIVLNFWNKKRYVMNSELHHRTPYLHHLR